MSEVEHAGGTRARSFFDGLWYQGDYWQLETSDFEHRKYGRQLSLLGDRRYSRVLEIGCGAGTFTRRLAPLTDRLVAVDVSPAAIERARSAGVNPSIEYRVANIMDVDLEMDRPWDLVVMSETVYLLGWLYSFFDVGWLASQIYGTTQPGGRFLMANTLIDRDDSLLRPPLVRTYRDLFVNVGFRVASEEVYRGVKDDTPLESLISLFEKRA